MRRSAAAFLLLLLAAATAPATLRPDEFVFAVPSNGLITLGVFDNHGRLVRTLHALDGEEKFQIGLNGYISRWDGLDDSGKKVAPGSYHIRGCQIGDATVSGEAFHFNDWINAADSPRISRIKDFQPLDNGDILLSAQTPSGPASARASIREGIVANEPTPPGNEEPARQKLAELSGRPPGDFFSVDAAGDTVLGAAADGVWISRNGSALRKIDLPVRVGSVSLGSGEAFWFAGAGANTDQAALVGEADFSGEILRALPYEADGPLPKKIRAAKSGAGFVVLDEAPGLQRLRSVTRDEAGEWVVDWEKTLRESGRFGFVNGEVTADAGEAPQLDSLRFRLEENPLTGERQTITIRAVADSRGTLLVNEDGLPLLRISDTPGIRRAVIQRGKSPDSLRLLQGDGAAVEEYLIEGLRHILPLNAGAVEIR